MIVVFCTSPKMFAASVLQSYFLLGNSYLSTIHLTWPTDRGVPVLAEHCTLKMKVIVLVFAVVAVTDGLKIETKKTQLVKLAKSGQCGPDESPCPSGCMACGCAPEETWCPSGCCPVANWFCCPDLMCAATAADCPFEAKRLELVKLAKIDDQCGPDETNCPVGCCPMGPHWYCCPDHFPICAPTAFDCPWSDSALCD